MTAEMLETGPTIRWWGPAPWDAPVCEDVPRVDIPVGQLCLDCRVKIERYDRGLSVPYARTRSGLYPPLHTDDWLVTLEPHHLECWMRSIGGEVTPPEALHSPRRPPSRLTRARALELRAEMWSIPAIAHEFDLTEDEVLQLLRNGD